MKKFLAQLRPMERRLAVGVLVVLILALNWIFIWPHFSDLGNVKSRIAGARRKITLYERTIGETGKYETLVKKYRSGGEYVPAGDQAINFMRTVYSQAASSGVTISSASHGLTQTGPFFTEQPEGIQVVATDAQLVDFLYKLGEGASSVRVRDLSLWPDPPHQRLEASIELVATYQSQAPSKLNQTAK
ncbi:MAG: hypothetical protein KGR98_05935 [Verrucomicrobia bacterium]|nr:hypothetical protein [Verrucomicrobiota bacterium]MDE3097928.1 hypothetical protein [Verrucomicrobiota bacterium]